jgi:hypothetical protein
MNNIRSSQAISSGWNRKKKVYARERQHDETHKVSKLLDQNNDTSFCLTITQKDTNNRLRV